MAAITIKVPEELVEEIRQNEERLPEILQLGLQQLHGNVVFEETTALLEFLAASPSPQEVLDLHASERLEQRLNELLEFNRTRGLNEGEQKEWERYEHVEHLVRMAKIRAQMKVASETAPSV
jgi:hypothetical protein